jgi:hypothetical protein
MIEVNIRYERDMDMLFDHADGFGIFHVQYRDADDLTSVFAQAMDLLDGCFHILGGGVGHALDDDGMIPADGDVTDCYFPGLRTLDHLDHLYSIIHQSTVFQ